MTPTWGALNARVRGLTGRLLGRARMRALAQCRDLATLAHQLEALGYARATPEAKPSPASLDHALRRVAAARLRVLALWSGPRVEGLAALFEDEDRRSLRAILRGAVAGAAPEKRLASTLPTPSLPERPLAELARQPTAAAVAALLLAWENPYGSAIWAEARRPQPDLFALELALSRRFAERALRAAPRAGRDLVGYVRETIALENVWSALALAGQPAGAHAAQCFLEGGAFLDRGRFIAAAETKDPEAATMILKSALADTRFASLPDSPSEWPTLEDYALRIQTIGWRRAARRNPLGVAPVIAYWLRLRAEVRDLRRLIWGVTLDAPRVELAEALVSVE